MNVWQCVLCKFDADGVFVRRTRPAGDLCTDCAATLARRGLKWCRGCRIAKPVDAFSRDGGQRDGRTTRCARCRAAKDADYRQRNPGRNVAARQRWEERHPEAYKARNITNKARWRLEQKRRALRAIRGEA